MALNYPSIDPVLIKLYGPLQIRWYGVSYLLGFLLGYYIVQLINDRFLAKPVLNKEQRDHLLLYILAGVIIGGRMGYIIIYQPELLRSAWQLWQGGMAFHGGLIGVTIAILYFAWRNRINAFSIGDQLALATPPGLFFGRIANFINDELWGRVTDVWWAIKFPSGGYLPRHPSQLYEAFGEGVVLMTIVSIAALRYKQLNHPGRVSGIYLLVYGVVRLFIEEFRQPNPGLDAVYLKLTMGQVWCLPMVAAGLTLIALATRKQKI